MKRGDRERYGAHDSFLARTSVYGPHHGHVADHVLEPGQLAEPGRLHDHVLVHVPVLEAALHVLALDLAVDTVQAAVPAQRAEFPALDLLAVELQLVAVAVQAVVRALEADFLVPAPNLPAELAVDVAVFLWSVSCPPPAELYTDETRTGPSMADHISPPSVA